MTLADKIKLIQDLQCKHAKGLAAFDTGLSLGLCVDSKMKSNIQVNYMVDTLYRYSPFTSAVTNADKITINVATTDPTEEYTISIAYGSTFLVEDAIIVGTQATVVETLVNLINAGTDSHEYYCISAGNFVYLYTYSDTYSYSDTPILTYEEANASSPELVITTTPLTSADLYLILDTINCLTLAEVCALITETKRLLSENC